MKHSNRNAFPESKREAVSKMKSRTRLNLEALLTI